MSVETSERSLFIEWEPAPLPPHHEMVSAMLAGDGTYDGVFLTAVRTTGIFCLPSCRPPRRPKPENVEFFATLREALFAGYRPCKLCRPLELSGGQPPWVQQLLQRLDADPRCPVRAEDLREMGLSPERVRRWFQQHYGMTFVEWCRGRRLGEAFTRIRDGAEIDDVALEFGYTSHSGFREAFSQTFGHPPGQAGQTERIVTTLIDSPIGPMLAATTDRGICLLEYTDRRMLERNMQTVRTRFQLPVVPGQHRWLAQLSQELTRYFAGQLAEFQTPLDPRGTPFQTRVWSALREIPHASTISYHTLAERIDQPTAIRAVANANGQNRINILIPCHRVIGKNGDLTGYGGGIWRKRLLLDLEQRTAPRPS